MSYVIQEQIYRNLDQSIAQARCEMSDGKVFWQWAKDGVLQSQLHSWDLSNKQYCECEVCRPQAK